MKIKSIIFILGVILNIVLSDPLFARTKIKRDTLYPLTEKGPVKVYLNEFTSKTDYANPQRLKEIMNEFLKSKQQPRFVITNTCNKADIMINCRILTQRYLEKDPVDQVIGGSTGLIIDLIIPQNYTDCWVVFDVYRTTDHKRLWHKKFKVSVTQSNMAEEESLPILYKEVAKRFVEYSFSKPK